MKDNSANIEDDSAPNDEILEEEDIDSDYEPSEGEILEYAKYLGMDLEEDKEYLWIAKEGLKAPLPSPWKACHTKDNEIYYFNFQNGESQWDHPMDQFYKQKFIDLKEKEKSIESKEPVRAQQNKFKLNLPIGQLNPQSQHPSSSQPATLNINSSNIKPNASNLQDSGISGLSYSHNTYQGENVSDIQKKADFDSGKRLDLALDKEEVNESLEFSNLDEDPRSKRSPKTRALEDIEKEYKNKVTKLEEELEIKFNQVVSDCEINYQKEAQRINKNYEAELKNLKENTFGNTGNEETGSDLEARKKQIENEYNKEMETHVAAQLENIRKDNEKKMKQLEEEFNKDLERHVLELKTNNDMEVINQKRLLKRKQDELILQRDGLLAKQETQVKDFSSNLEKRKAEATIDFERKLRELENEESKKLARELEIYKKELSFIMERERMNSEPSSYRKNRVNDMGLRKIELRELFHKRLDLEKHRLYEENERSIKEMLELEKIRIEENAGKAFDPSLRNEYERKYNNLALERAAVIETNKKRLDEAQLLFEKKFENDKKLLGKEYRHIIERLNTEISFLTSEISQKEALRGQSSKLSKEIEDSERESLEKDKKIARLAKDLEDLSLKVTESAQMLGKLNIERNKFNELVSKKNQMLIKIDEMQKRIEDIDKSIENLKIAPSISRLNDTNAYITTKNSTERLSQNLSMVSLARLVKEVEDIKGMIKKKKASRSLSAEKVQIKRKFAKNNVTIDHGKMYSFDDDDDSDFEYEDKRNKNILKGINQNPSGHKIKKLNIDNMNSRLEEINDLENQELSEIPSTASFKNGQMQFNARINWARLVPSEKEYLQRLDEVMKKKKLEIKEIQADIMKEQTQYKQDYNLFKASFENNPSNQKKLRLDMSKKALNTKIQEYNHALNQLRIQEGLLNKKKELHRGMEIALNKLLTDQAHDQAEIDFLYRSYHEIKIDLEENEPLASEPRNIEPFGESCDEAKMPPKEEQQNKVVYQKHAKPVQKSTEYSREKQRHPIKIEDEEENSQFAGNISDLRDPSDYSRVRSRGPFFDERSYIQERSYAQERSFTYERSTLHDRQRLLNLRHQLKAEKYFDRYDDLIRKYSTHY